MSDLKIQGEVSLDTTGADQAFGRVEQSATRMAQAVGQAGQSAGTAMESGIVAAVKRASAATQEASQQVMTWTGFLKQNMGPAMKEALDAGASHAEAHTAAIRKIAVQWQAYKDTVKSAGAAAANAGAQVAQSTAAAGAASDKLTASQARLLSTLERESIQLVRGKSAWREHQAAMLGVTEAATPYITKIKQAETAQVNLGMSAKQTAFALRGVPAQFTDIFTSLQAGQRPMSVLLQQGGQLKDMFGGIGPAARAMGGYVLGLVNPFTITAGIVGALGYALLQGSKELTAFQAAATMSGNAIGLTAGQFASMRDGIAGIAGSKGKAAEVLTEIAANGRFAGDSIKGIAEAAILMEKATGQAVKKTLDQFAELAKSPAEASAKLNEQYNYLTASVYKQIKALEEQGRAQDAANLAETTYAEALKSRSQSVVDNAGLMEKAWRGITGAAKGAWDSMLDVGRASTLSQQLAGVRGEIAAASGADKNRQFRMPWEEGIDSLRLRESSLLEQIRLEARVTAEKSEQNRLQALGISFDKQGEEFKSKSAKREEELSKARREGQELVNKEIITQAALTQRLNDIRKKYAETTGQGEVAGIKGRIDSQRELNERLRKQISGDAPLTDSVQPTEGEKLRSKLLRELETGIFGVARAQKVKALADAEELIGEEKKGRAYEATVKALKESQAALEKQVDAVAKQADAIRDQAIGQETVNANFGKSKTAIEQATLAQLKLQAAEADSSDRFAPAYVAALMAKTEAQERYVKALQETEYKQAALKLDESNRLAVESAQTLQLEISLLGRTQQELERIIAQRKVEIALAKELAEIDKLNLGVGDRADEKRDALKAKARANAVIDANSAVSKAVLDEWQRTADSINNSLTDALLRGFESGKGFAENLRDTIANMFKTLVLRPVIQAVMAPVSGAISSYTSSVLGNGTSGLSNLSSMNTLYQGGTGYMNGGIYGAANNLGFGSQFAAGGLFVQTGAASGAMGVGGGMGGASGAAELAGTAASNGAAGSGMAAAAPFAAILAPLFAAYADGFFSGEKRGGAQYGYSFNGTTVTNARRGTQQTANGVGATYLEGPDGGDPAAEATKLVINSTVAGINDALRSFGSTATLTGYQAAYETSQNGRGGVFAGGRLSTGRAFGESGQGSNQPGSNGADPSRSLYEMWGAQIGAFGTTGLDTNGSPEKLATDAAQSYIEAIQASAGLIPRIVKEQFQRDLSGSTSGYTFGATMGGGDRAETVTDPTVTTFRRVYDDAMKASARELGLLPKKILDLVIDIDPEALSAEATAALATKIQTLVNNVNGFRTIVETLPVEQLRNATFDIAASLIELSGGVEKFASSISSYVENFYSAEEKRRSVAGNISAALAGAGINVSADTLLATTREQFRAVVEGQDLTTESGQRAYAALIGVSGAFASITEAAASASDQLRDTINAQRDTITSQRAYARELRSFRDGLLLGDKSPLNVLEKQAEAERQFNATLAGARSGDPTARAALTGASGDYLSASLASARSKIEYDTIFAKVSSALTLTASDADSRATVAEQQLSIMTSQLDALGAINANVQSFADAFAAYTSTQSVLEAAKAAAQVAVDAALAAIKRPNSTPSTPVATAPTSGGGSGGGLWGLWDPSNSFAAGTDYFPGGVRMVGEGGPELEVTGPSRIFSASQTRDILQGGGNQAMADEIRQLRAQVALLIEAANANAQHSYKSAKALDQLNVRGVQIRDRDDQTTPSVQVV